MDLRGGQCSERPSAPPHRSRQASGHAQGLALASLAMHDYEGLASRAHPHSESREQGDPPGHLRVLELEVLDREIRELQTRR